MQSIVVFGILTVAGIILSFVPYIGWLVPAVSFILWVVLMVKAYQGAKYKLPWAGNLAERLVG